MSEKDGDNRIIIVQGANLKYNLENLIEIEEYKIDAKTVDVVDTIGAGASFNGALAYKLTSGSDLRKAVEFANTVAALTVTKRGAIPSLPAIEDVLQFHE